MGTSSVCFLAEIKLIRESHLKTYEGAIGATLIGALLGIVYAIIFQNQLISEVNIEIYWFYIIPFVLSIMAQRILPLVLLNVIME